ncbi:MAG: outer membrane lipoprotein carrier protein LolA [Prevotellaceae bacterium]|jgi:outer membrane lipoprotein-sorting protein|nr:outer membrane lipoprotein carrier protein LolA [Prevotellaceae bacterium]
MKKIICITFLLSVFCGSVFSQKKLSESEKAAFEQKMMEQSKKIKTLQCDFVQEKTSALVAEKAVAKGILLYQSPSMLRWEYTAPTPSILILNGNNAALFNKDGNRVGNDKMIKQLGGLIISIINGDGIKNSKQFSTEVFETDSQFRVVLTPVQKRLKEFYQSIELKIDKNTFLASEIVMNEKSGDKTVIYLNNKKLNEKIDINRFAI